jgi:hypothetical protein
VDIRTLCHHNGCLEWLRFAFAEPVREEFRRRYGREVKPEPDDYEKVRRLRGEFFTQFLREAKAVTRRYGKKLAIHFEPRMGVPASLEPVMQIFWDWETWLNEGIMDELTLKYWTSHSTYIHEKVLPVARRKGIPVLVECQLIDPRTDVRGVEKAERVIREAHAAGFDGVIWYEAWGFLMPNPAGGTTRRGIAEPMIRKADEIRNAL